MKPSLLFVLVDEKEIRSNLAKNQNKYDHGVLSTISLLLTFYESGRINKLPLDKQTAIELAAVAIYNHNFSYKINTKEAKNYFRPVFVQNPISFLLKICDEMQEWERKYFELSKTDAPIFCPVCKSPIVEHKNYQNINDIKVFKETLLCRCPQSNNEYIKSIYFPHRNIYTVTTCKAIDMIATNNKSVVFHLDYNLSALLHMSKIEYGYANYRSKELNNLKVLLGNQKFYSNNSNFAVENVYLDYVMTYNPIYLKARMLLESEARKVDNWPSNFENNEMRRYELYKNYNEFYNKTRKNLDFKGKIEKCFKKLIVAPFDFDKETYASELNKCFRFIKNDDAFHYKLILRPNPEDKQELCNLAVRLLGLAGIHFDKAVLAERLYSDAMNCLYESLEKKAKKYAKELLKKYLGETNKDTISFFSEKLMFYADVASFISQSLAEDINYTEKEYLNHLIKSYENKYPDAHKSHTEVVKMLLKDAFSIISNQNDVYNGRINMSKYIKHFKPNKEVFFAMQQYITPANWYENNCDAYRLFSSKNLDFYSDLIFFELISDKLD